MLDFIVNPSAGGSEGQKVKKALPKIEEYLKKNDITYRVHYTNHPHHATELTESLIKIGAKKLVVMGGDGTLHEVINGFCDFDKTAMGIIPCGTGNDFATALKLPFDPIEALKLIIETEPKYTDFMQMPTVRGLNIIGTGIDVDVLKKYAMLKKKTKFGYTKCLLKVLLNPKLSKFRSEINGRTEDRECFLAAVANGHCYGGGIAVCPCASPADKQLDLVCINKLRRLQIVRAFLKMKKGKLFDVKQVTHENMQEIKLTRRGHYTVNVDGELYDDIPFEVKIVSDTLRVFRP